MTRLKRKALKNVLKAKNRRFDLKRHTFVPIIKKIDTDDIKSYFPIDPNK